MASDNIAFGRKPGQRVIVVGCADDEKRTAQSFSIPESDLDDAAWAKVHEQVRDAVHQLRSQLEPGWTPPKARAPKPADAKS